MLAKSGKCDLIRHISNDKRHLWWYARPTEKLLFITVRSLQLKNGHYLRAYYDANSSIEEWSPNLTANFRGWFLIEECLLVLSYKPVGVLRSFITAFDTYSSLVWMKPQKKMSLSPLRIKQFFSLRNCFFYSINIGRFMHIIWRRI